MNKRPFLRLLIAVLTFSAGVMTVAVWLAWHRHYSRESTSLPCFPQSTAGSLTSPAVGEPYFPPASFSPDEKLDHLRTKLPLDILATMNEPSYLSSANCEGKGYRLLLIHTNHSPIAVRVWKSGDEQYLVTKQLDGEGGNRFGKNLVMRTSQLTEQDWSTIESIFNRASFWELPKFDTALSTQESSDSVGSLWIIEGFDNQQYHIVSRWSPQDGDYRRMGLYLLQLGSVEIDAKYLN